MRIWLLTKPGAPSIAQRALVARAVERGIELELVMPESCTLRLTSGRLAVWRDGAVIPLPDAVLNRRGASGTHVTFTLTRHLEAAGIPVINSTWATQLGRDKAAALQRVAAAGLPVPRTTLVPLALPHPAPEYPIVVKTGLGSQGSDVFLCRDAPAYEALMIRLRSALGPDHSVLLQAFVPCPDPPIRDLRVFVVGGEAVGTVMRSAAPGEWRTNLAVGGKGWEVPLDPAAATLSVAVCGLLGLDVGGVDLLLGPDGYVFSEVNPAPLFHTSEPTFPLSYDMPDRIFDLVASLLR